MRRSKLIFLALMATGAANNGTGVAGEGFLGSLKTMVGEGWRNGMRSIASAYGKDYSEMKMLLRRQDANFQSSFKDLCEDWTLSEQSKSALPLAEREQFESSLVGLRSSVEEALETMYGQSVVSDTKSKLKAEEVVSTSVRAPSDPLDVHMNILMQKHEQEQRVALEALRLQQEEEMRLMSEKLEVQKARRNAAAVLVKRVQAGLHDANTLVETATKLVSKFGESNGKLDTLSIKLQQLLQAADTKVQTISPMVVCEQAGQMESLSVEVKTGISLNLQEVNELLSQCAGKADEVDTLLEELADLGQDVRGQTEQYTLKTADVRVSIGNVRAKLQTVLAILEPKQIGVDGLLDRLEAVVNQLGQQLAAQLQQQVQSLKQFTEEAAVQSKNGIEGEAEELLLKLTNAAARIQTGYGDALIIAFNQMKQLVSAWLMTVESARNALDGATDVARKIITDVEGLTNPTSRSQVDTMAVRECIEKLKELKKQIRQASAFVTAKLNALQTMVQEQLMRQNQMGFGNGGYF